MTMDYKELIDALRNKPIPSPMEFCEWTDLIGKAADELEHLDTEIERLKNSNDVLRAERDELHKNNCGLRNDRARLRAELNAAVADMSGICYLCGNAKPYRAGSPTMMTCKHMDCLATMKKPGCKFFKWRGAKGENDG